MEPALLSVGEAFLATSLITLILARFRKRKRNPSKCRVVGLYVYPVKGFQGNAVEEVEVLQRGFEYDRRFMVIDEEGNFTTQRENPIMATITCEILENKILRLTSTVDGTHFDVKDWAGKPVRRTVRVWKSFVDNAIDQGDQVAEFISRLIGKPYRLVFMHDDVHRPVNPDYADGHEVSFADGFPFLLASVSSLADLNRRIEATGENGVPMERFRPNIVVEGLYPWTEDVKGMQLVFPSGHVIKFVKPCDRCKVTTTDQKTGEVNPLQEPLRTMRTFRKITGGMEVFFATNGILVQQGEGKLRLGDVAKIVWPGQE